MSLKYEPASEPLHISAPLPHPTVLQIVFYAIPFYYHKTVKLFRAKRLVLVQNFLCDVCVAKRFLRERKLDLAPESPKPYFFFFFITLKPRVE